MLHHVQVSERAKVVSEMVRTPGPEASRRCHFLFSPLGGALGCPLDRHLRRVPWAAARHLAGVLVQYGRRNRPLGRPEATRSNPVNPDGWVVLAPRAGTESRSRLDNGRYQSERVNSDIAVRRVSTSESRVHSS